jgi:zinc protease
MEVERYQLDNGLTLLLSVDHAAPVVCYQTWFAVGSRHEREGKTGIAHFFEHLMFGGTENVPSGEFDRRLEEAGAESNAATYLDWTYYVENLPKEALDLVVELESDRMQHLVLRDAEVDSEREVVCNERRQTVDDDVDGRIAELLFTTAFEHHGYRWPTIGFMADIKGLSTDDCRAFYRSYYAPNNATLVIVGDVQRDSVLARIEKAYGSIPSSQIEPEPAREEPEQSGRRRARLKLPCSTQKLAMGFKCPPLSHDDHAPLVLLNEILFGGRASRLHRELVQQRELCSEMRGYVGAFEAPSLLEVYGSCRGEQPSGPVIDAVDAAFERAGRELVSDSELGRAKARVELATLQGLETVGGRAEQIGFHATVLDDPCAAFSRLAAFRSASADDLQRVAQRYLQPRGSTVVEAEPDQGGGAEASA